MLRFITKEEYWCIEDSGILNELPKKIKWHLKSIQDAIAFNILRPLKNKTIAEIGGGDSRILPVIATKNKCYNIEEFKGLGGGPQQEIFIEGVRNINALIGQYSGKLQVNYFDYIFSISVIEHVHNNMLTDFFDDCYRILKSGGYMIHLIDVYLEDNLASNKEALCERLIKYRSTFKSGMFRSPDLNDYLVNEEDLNFSTTFATNPDNVMNQWNKLVPALKTKRIKSQSCSLILFGMKV